METLQSRAQARRHRSFVAPYVPGFPFNTTLVNNFRIIGQGTGNNFLVHETFHITVNADGTMTAFVDNFSVDCKQPGRDRTASPWSAPSPGSRTRREDRAPTHQ